MQKKIKRSRLHINEESCNVAWYKVHKLISNKKKLILKINQMSPLVNQKSYGKP